MNSPAEILELCEEIGAAGVWLRYDRSEDRLYHAPVGRASSELAARISAHRDALVEMMVEDEELRRTGVLQSERQVLEECRSRRRKGGGRVSI